MPVEASSRVARILLEFRHVVLHARALASQGRRILRAPPYPPTLRKNTYPREGYIHQSYIYIHTICFGRPRGKLQRIVDERIRGSVRGKLRGRLVWTPPRRPKRISGAWMAEADRGGAREFGNG